VPRLNRLEMRRVIEEPAMLNGDEISPRLVERLLYDLEEGNDQLPVLQHALSRIWQLAAEKGESMDLLHYAKAGGMKAEELPEENQAEFQNWLAAQAQELQPVFSRPGLDNVLNLHAEGLLLEAVEICRKKNLHGNDSSAVPEAIFRCLTQVDRGRVVRNQVSAEELLQVLEIPGLQLEELDAVSAVFRKPGNTFLRPFISEESTSLKADSVLDITHESLIRNWDKLAEWTDAEEKDKQTFHDFDKQLQRWQESGKSSDYLLPIGPLNQFENWFNKKKPNAGWLAGLNEEEKSRDLKQTEAGQKLEAAKEFLRKSARRLLLTRTVMKYGANRILLLAGCLVVALSCLYYYLEYRYKQNDAVIERVLTEGKELMANPNVTKEQKARFAILWERHHGENSFVPLLDSLHNDTLAFDVGLEMFENIFYPVLADQYNSNWDNRAHPILPRVCDYLEKVGLRFAGNGTMKAINAKRISQLVLAAAAVHHLGSNEEYRKMAEKASGLLLEKFLLPLVEDTGRRNSDPGAFFQSMQVVLFLSKDLKSLQRIYAHISPGRVRFNELFPEGQDFDLAEDGKIPRLGGYLLQQLLAERCGARKQADSLFRINKINFYNQALKEEIIRQTFCIGLISGRKWPAEQLDYNPEKMAEMLLEFRKIPNPSVKASLFFPISPMLKWSEKRKFIELLSDASQETTYSQDPYMKPLVHKARCIWFESYGLTKEAKQEAEKSIALLKKMNPPGLLNSPDSKPSQILSSLFSKTHTNLHFFESANQNRGFSKFSREITWGSEHWSSAFIQSGLAAGYKDYLPVRKFLGNYLTEKICGDSVRLVAAKSEVNQLLNLADENPGIIQYDSLQALHCLYELKKDFSCDARNFHNSEKSSAVARARFQEIRKMAVSAKASGLLPRLAYWLAMRGCISESITLLNRLPLSKRREVVADIVLKMNESGAYAEFMPAILDKAFQAGEEKPVFPSSLFEAISSTGGLRFFQFGFGLLREQEESKKPKHLHHFVIGLSKVGLLHQAKNYFPNESSSDGKLRLLNVILEHEDFPSLRGKEWDAIHFPFKRGNSLTLNYGFGIIEVDI
jgi:hypothetical protein